jgi:hypothetical protein
MDKVALAVTLFFVLVIALIVFLKVYFFGQPSNPVTEPVTLYILGQFWYG